MINSHRQLDIHLIAAATLVELRQTGEFFASQADGPHDEEVREAFALCARNHAELLRDLSSAGLDESRVDVSQLPSAPRDFSEVDAALATGDLQQAGDLLATRVESTLTLLECVFSDYPALAVRRAIKQHVRGIMECATIMRRLAQRRVATHPTHHEVVANRSATTVLGQVRARHGPLAAERVAGSDTRG